MNCLAVQEDFERAAGYLQRLVDLGHHLFRYYVSGDSALDNRFLTEMKSRFFDRIRLKSLDFSGRFTDWETVVRYADAIRHLRSRPYFDGDRVGIVGSSYGGYMAAMGIFKHPDVYAASVNKSGVTDWRNYDTIYTERYMSTPQLNTEGYHVGTAMTYVDDFKGKILILHGMIDDNVHPNNAFQLIDAMDKAGKPYESRFFPNRGHGTGSGGTESQWEFFNRILKPNMN